MSGTYIVDAIRTPMGRIRGQLAHVRPDDLAAHAVRSLCDRNSEVDPGAIEDVVWGAANQAGEDNRNVGRMAALLAGLPREVSGVTVNRLCGSGMQAVVTAGHALSDGWGDLMIAGGSESMSRAPVVMLKSDQPFSIGTPVVADTVLGWRLVNPQMERDYPPLALGLTAERVAEKYGVTRAQQDAFAMTSHVRAALAQEDGRFDAEIAPIEVPADARRRSTVLVDTDEGGAPRHKPRRALETPSCLS